MSTTTKTKTFSSVATHKHQKQQNLLPPHRVVIVGGGAGGLELATSLGNDLAKKKVNASVILVNDTLTHVWKPLLHGYSAGTLNTYQDELNYFGHSSLHNYDFHVGKLTNIHCNNKFITLAPLVQTIVNPALVPKDKDIPSAPSDSIGGTVTIEHGIVPTNNLLPDIPTVLNMHSPSPHTPLEQHSKAFQTNILAPERKLHYDTLVLAIGSVSNDFGTKGVREYAISIDDRSAADRFQKRFFSNYLSAQAKALISTEGLTKLDNLDVHRERLDITVIGSGATGVELIGELQFACRNMRRLGVRHSIEEGNVHLNLVEAAPRILPAFPESISQPSHVQLEALGINVFTSAKVTEVTKTHVHLADGQQIPTTLCVWAAGIKAPEFLKDVEGLELNPRTNQVMLRPTLQTTTNDNIFALGDVAHIVPINSHDGRAAPPTAQNAHQQSSFLRKSLMKRIMYLEQQQKQQHLSSSATSSSEQQPPPPLVLPEYRYHDMGALVTVGVDHAFGRVGQGLNVKGFIAQAMHYSLYRMHQIQIHGLLRTLSWMFKDLIDKGCGIPQIKLH